jgi:tryptophan synthase beta chain
MPTATATPPRLDRFSLPDAGGHFGGYGGVFVPETLMTALQELGRLPQVARHDPAFQAELQTPPEGIRRAADRTVFRQNG